MREWMALSTPTFRSVKGTERRGSRQQPCLTMQSCIAPHQMELSKANIGGFVTCILNAATYSLRPHTEELRRFIRVRLAPVRAAIDKEDRQGGGGRTGDRHETILAHAFACTG